MHLFKKHYSGLFLHLPTGQHSTLSTHLYSLRGKKKYLLELFLQNWPPPNSDNPGCLHILIPQMTPKMINYEVSAMPESFLNVPRKNFEIIRENLATLKYITGSVFSAFSFISSLLDLWLFLIL